MDKDDSFIKNIRISLGFSQTEFAKKLGIKQSTLSDIERGKSKMTTKVISKLHKDLNVSAEYLISEQGDMFIGNNDNSVTEIIDKTESKLHEKVLQSVTNTNIGTNIDAKYIENQLNSIIKNKLWYMDFYIKGMLYHVGRYNEETNKVKFDEKKFDLKEKYINQFIGDVTKNEKPSYMSMNIKDKLQLINDLDEATRLFLDEIWITTREIW